MSHSAAVPEVGVEVPADLPTLHLKIGALDFGSTGLLRHVLSRAEEPGVHVVVDLREMDDAHELTLFALLATKALAVADATGDITAVRPSLRLAHLLSTIGVTITREVPVLAGLASIETVTIGRLFDRGP